MVKQKLRSNMAMALGLLCLCGYTQTIANEVLDSAAAESQLVGKLYDLVSRRVYSKAVGVLDDLTLDYQSSSKHSVYQLEAMHANFKEEAYEKVATIADAYLAAYPYSKHVDYVMYMQALALHHEYTADIDNTMQSWMHLGEHDTTGLEKAQSVLGDFLTKYPDSVYYPDAALLYKQVSDKLIANDFEVAREYNASKAFFASQDRLLRVIKSAYTKDMALRALKVMESNYKAMRLDVAANVVKGIILLNQ